MHDKSPKFELALKNGSNRLLVKVCSARPKTWRDMKFAARLYDPDPAAYDEKNIAVVDENRIYIRGEQYLYCIGAK